VKDKIILGFIDISLCLFIFGNKSFVSPNSARVIFRSCDYSVSFIVECTGENFILVTIEYLDFLPGISVPNSASLITACGNDFVSLWVELDFRYFIVMTL